MNILELKGHLCTGRNRKSKLVPILVRIVFPRGSFLLLIYFFGICELTHAVAYVTEVEGAAYAVVGRNNEKFEVTIGAQIPDDSALMLSSDSHLELLCSYSLKLKKYTESTNESLCSGPVERPDQMRSDSGSVAPVLISPRSNRVHNLHTIKWGSAQPGNYRIQINALDRAGASEILSHDVPSRNPTRKGFPVYSYKLDDSTAQKILPNKLYQIVIYDFNTGKNSSGDQVFDGTINTVSEKDLTNDIETISKKFDNPSLAAFVDALMLKEQGLATDASLIFADIQVFELRHLAQYQIAQIYIKQKVPVDFVAFEIVQAIKMSSAADDYFTAYMSCMDLSNLYMGLSDQWKKEISKFSRLQKFKKACPLFG